MARSHDNKREAFTFVFPRDVWARPLSPLNHLIRHAVPAAVIPHRPLVGTISEWEHLFGRDKYHCIITRRWNTCRTGSHGCNSGLTVIKRRRRSWISQTCSHFITDSNGDYSVIHGVSISGFCLLLSAVQHVAFAPPPTGNTCQNGLMPALVRPTMPAVQTSLGMKHFLPFPLDTAVRLFPGFNAVSLDKVILTDTSVLIVDMSDFVFSRCFFSTSWGIHNYF